MKISFFCKVSDTSALNKNLFYVQDINILKNIDPTLKIATRWRDIDYSADVIFIWWWSYAFVPVIIGKLLGKKTIITGTFNYDSPDSPNDFKKKFFLKRMLIMFSLKFVSKNIFVSKREFEIFRDRLKIPNIVYIPHGVYVEDYKPTYKRDSNMLLTISWLESNNLERKCIFKIVDAFALLRKQDIDLRLVIAGREGDAIDKLNKYISDLKLDEHIDVMVDITEGEKIKLLSTCKIYLQPSLYEGFGVAIAEAMSCGCAIVTSKAGEIPNVVGDTAIVLEETNPKTIAEAIVSLISDKEIYESYQTRARERISRLFSVERRNKAINELLDNL